MPRSRDELEFVLIAEAGALEAQALLLCESIRYFAGAYAKSAITVISPRGSRRPSLETLRSLNRLNAEYLPIEIESCCPEYGTSYRVHAIARAERRPGPPILVQLDSDTIFVAEPDFSLVANGAAARPVDVKGMCTAGAGDPFEKYWRDLCALVGVNYDGLPLLLTTVDCQTVRASYNGGLLVGQRSSGIFQRTEDIFRRLVAARMMPWSDGPTVSAGSGTVSGAATAYWGSSQAAFAMASLAGNHEVRILPDTYNFPLHLLNDMRLPPPPGLVHIHYHNTFMEAQPDRTILSDKLHLPLEATKWLGLRLPLLGSLPGGRHLGKPAVPAVVSQSERQAILVLGMHRSGTSALGGVINAMGAAAPKTDFPADTHNPLGYFESKPFVEMNEELLKLSGSSWDDWRPLDQSWNDSPAAQPHRNRVKAVLRKEFGNRPLPLIKDPRICRFVGFVSAILREINISPVAFVAVRNPLEVAYSLRRRDGMPVAKGLLLWLRHVLDSEFQSRTMPRCFVTYEQLLQDCHLHIDRAAKQTGIVWPEESGRTSKRITRFVSEDLHHQVFTSEELNDHPSATPIIRITYETLTAMALHGESRERLEQLDLLRLKFDEACELLGWATATEEATSARLRSELAAQVAEATTLKNEGKARIQAHDLLTRDRDAILASRSWRLTAPLRWLRKPFVG